MERTATRLGTLILALTALSASVSAAPLAARTVAEIEARALAEYDEGHFEAALARYREAYAVSPFPELAFMQGRCHEALGRLAEALDAYERVLAGEPPDDLRARAQTKVADLRSALGRARLIVLVAPAGAAVSLDGQEVGHAPLPPLDVVPGRHAVLALHPGYTAVEQEVEVARGSETSVRLELPPIPAAPPPIIVSAPPPPPPDLRPWGWAATGVSGAALVAGAVLLGVSSSEWSDLRGLEDEDPVRSTTEAAAYDKRDRARDEEIAGWTLIGVAGVTAAAAVTLLVLDSHVDPNRDVQPVAVLPALTPHGGTGLFVRGRF